MDNNLEYLKEYLNRLIDEFYVGYNYLTIYNNLQKCKNKYQKEYDTFLEFFSKFSESSLELAYFSLFKLLEESKRSPKERPITIRDFLNYFSQNLNRIERELIDKKEIRKQIKSDQNWFSSKQNNKIKTILDLRNNSLAHLDKEYLSLGTEKKIDFLISSKTRDP